ncbi:MAG: hypothetical protein R3E76_02445 [Planctomycetota bacterium]
MFRHVQYWFGAVLLCALAATSNAQNAAGQKTITRAEKDAQKFLPQTGLGGDESGRVAPGKSTFETLKIEVDGCEKMEGYICLPEDLDKDKKYALMFTFHGNGDVGAGRVKNVARISSDRDPVITVGVQYQELTEAGKGQMGLPQLASSDKIFEGSRWLLDKVMKDQPVDPNRVFVSGFSWGTAWASQWACKEWREDPDNFPFRAIFLYSSPGYPREKAECPPVPWFCTVGSTETKVAGSVNVIASVRQFCNRMSAWGMPVLYHEIPGMGHAVNGRCHQITRDAINELGGPGALPYPEDGETVRAEPLPFDASDDPYVREVIDLCNADDWAGALARIEQIKDDKEIGSKEKREIKHFDKDIEKVAKKEIKRVDDLVQDAVKAGKMPAPYLIKRLRAITETWAEESWVKGKGYDETLAFLETDFAPVKREHEREQMMKDALVLEAQEGKREEAKAKYQALAKRADEDEGRSVWPKAAEYRLSWWIDG